MADKNAKITPENIKDLPKNETIENKEDADIFSPEAVNNAEETAPTLDDSTNVQELIAKLQSEIDEVKSLKEQLNKRIVDDGVFASKVSANDLEAHKTRVQLMKDKLNSQPKTKIFVPLEGQEKVGQASLPVTLNGFRLNVPKGIYVEVPEQIGAVIMESLNQTALAYENKFRLDNSDNPVKLEALS